MASTGVFSKKAFIEWIKEIPEDSFIVLSNQFAGHFVYPTKKNDFYKLPSVISSMPFNEEFNLETLLNRPIFSFLVAEKNDLKTEIL